MKSHQKPVVSIFGSSRPGPGEPEYIQAYELGKELARAGFVVCNGGYGGTMEASARGARQADGTTIGVISGIFGNKPANEWIDQVIVVKTLFERLMKLVSLADAYIALKGGTGTLLELAAVWELMNKNMIQEKPIIIIGGFWDGVVRTLKEELAWEGLNDCTRYVTMVDSPLDCVRVLGNRLKIAGKTS